MIWLLAAEALVFPLVFGIWISKEIKKMSAATDALSASIDALTTSVDQLIAKASTQPPPVEDLTPQVVAATQRVNDLKVKIDAAVGS
jgi:uncharacterized protein YoxC